MTPRWDANGLRDRSAGGRLRQLRVNDAQISQKFIGSGNDEGSRQDVAFLDAKATG
jgi:hypothetical protein